MKKNNYLIGILFVFFLFSCGETEKPKENIQSNNTSDSIQKQNDIPPKNESISKEIPALFTGDILLQTSEGHQSDLVSIATQSPFSHCGILVVKKDGSKLIIEANGRVKETPLDNWIASGKDGKFVVMRLKDNSVLTGDKIKSASGYIKSVSGKNYDSMFFWSDDEFYCSELVWKAYKNGLQIELSLPKKLKEYDLTSESVKEELNKRYGKNIPLEEPMVSPADIASSDLLQMIYSNY